MAQVINASTARQDLSKILNRVFKERARVIVEKSGIPIAAIISAEDLRRLDTMEKEREERFKVIDSIREAFKDIPDEEIDREVDKAVAEVRHEMQQEK